MVFSKVTGLPLSQGIVREPARVDYDLVKANYKTANIDLSERFPTPQRGLYEFSVTDNEFYSVMSVVESPNGLLLLHVGMRSAEEVTKYLRDAGMRSLLRSYSHLTDAAVSSEMRPLLFVQFMEGTNSSERHCEFAADAVRAFALENSEGKNVNFFGSLSRTVISGELRFKDLEEIGPALIHRNSDLEPLLSRLYDLASNTEYCEFDVTHIRKAIQRRMDDGMKKNNAHFILLLMSVLDGDFALNLRNPEKVATLVPINEVADKDFLLYADSVFTAVEDTPTRVHLDNLYRHGITLEDAIDGLKEGRSSQQIIAMTEGVEAALTGGWL